MTLNMNDAGKIGTKCAIVSLEWDGILREQDFERLETIVLFWRYINQIEFN